ncbi:PIR protein, partial [Plasmodium vivax]
MECSEDSREGNYVFFDNIESYIKYAEEAENTKIEGKVDKECGQFSKDWRSMFKTEEIAKNTCGHFMNLYKKFPSLKDNNDPNYEKDYSFLNYWINMKIYINKNNENTCVQSFYRNIDAYVDQILTDYTSIVELYDIIKDDFNKINILYILYKNYYKLKSGLSTILETNKTSLLPYSNECYDTYKIAETMLNDQDTTFNEKLTKFTSDYIKLYPKFEEKEKEFNIYFKRLSDKQINIITTSVFGSLVGLIPFMGILYK